MNSKWQQILFMSEALFYVNNLYIFLCLSVCYSHSLLQKPISHLKQVKKSESDQFFDEPEGLSLIDGNKKFWEALVKWSVNYLQSLFCNYQYPGSINVCIKPARNWELANLHNPYIAQLVQLNKISSQYVYYTCMFKKLPTEFTVIGLSTEGHSLLFPYEQNLFPHYFKSYQLAWSWIQ